MSRFQPDSFLRLDEADLAAYADAQAADIDLVIAAQFRAEVLENLAVLQAHARKVELALKDMDAAASPFDRGLTDTGTGSEEARRI